MPIPPSAEAALAGATVLANLSGSPITVARAEDRRLLVRSASARCIAAYVYAAAGQGESTTDLCWDGQTMVYECGDLLAEGERFPEAPAHDRRHRPRPAPPGPAAAGHASTTTGVPTTSGSRAFRTVEFELDPPDRRHRAAAQGGPLPVRPRRPGAARARLLRGLQHPGLGARAAARGHRPAQGDHRRQRRPRLDARADRHRQGDGPARPSAHRHPRVHDAGVRDRRDHEVVRHPAGQVARRHLRGARHPPRRRADARRPRPPLRRRRAGLRRHVRERPGRPALRLPLPAGQPPRRHRGRHRRPLRAGARLVHLRRRRPDVALQRQRRRPEDAGPAPDPLGDRAPASSTRRPTRCSRRSSSRRSPPS